MAEPMSTGLAAISRIAQAVGIIIAVDWDWWPIFRLWDAVVSFGINRYGLSDEIILSLASKSWGDFAYSWPKRRLLAALNGERG